MYSIRITVNCFTRRFVLMSLPNDKGLGDRAADVDSPSRTYALIESDPHELDHIIDIFRQFFPKTRIVECHKQPRGTSQTSQPRQTSMETISSIHTSRSSRSSFDNEMNSDVSPSAHSQVGFSRHARTSLIVSRIFVDLSRQSERLPSATLSRPDR